MEPLWSPGALTAGLPRSYEVFVHGRVEFRVGQIVYLAFSRDGTLMGFALPKEEREAALEPYPDKFGRPKTKVLCQWLVVRLDAIDEQELRELVFDAWRMVVPKKLSVLPTTSSSSEQRASRPARPYCEDGEIRVFEVWDSREQAEAWGEKVMAVRTEAGFGDGPPSIEYLGVHNVVQR